MTILGGILKKLIVSPLTEKLHAEFETEFCCGKCDSPRWNMQNYWSWKRSVEVLYHILSFFLSFFLSFLPISFIPLYSKYKVIKIKINVLHPAMLSFVPKRRLCDWIFYPSPFLVLSKKSSISPTNGFGNWTKSFSISSLTQILQTQKHLLWMF